MGDDRRAELQAEYFHLQKTYEDFDQRSLTIKGWIAAAAVTGASLGVNRDTKQILPEVSLIVAVVLLSIWCLETYWKMFQYGFQNRIRILEAHFRDDKQLEPSKENQAPFQIYHSWSDCYVHDRPIYRYEKTFRPSHFVFRFASVMCHPFVFLPYLPLLAICVAYYPNSTLHCVAGLALAVLFIAGTGHYVVMRRRARAARR